MATLCNIYKPGKFLLGNFRYAGIGWFAPIGLKLTEHVFIIGSNGSGKSTQIIDNIALHDGPMMLIDPKSELTEATFDRLSDGGKSILSQHSEVAVFDPDGQMAHKTKSACFNIFDVYQHIEKDFGEDALVKAVFRTTHTLITEDNKLQPFFSNASRAAVQGVTLFVHHTEPPERRNLVRVRKLLTQGLHEKAKPDENPTDVLWYEMLKYKDAYGGIIAARATAMLEMSENGRNAVYSTIRAQMQSFDLPGVQKLICHSTFDIFDLKKGNLKLIFTANGTDMEFIYSDVIGLMIETALTIFEIIPGNLKKPCYMIIDEFQNVLSLRSLSAGIAKLRGYGLRVVAMCQSLSGLKAKYPDHWRDFLGNATFSMWFAMGKSDTEGPEYLSSVLGQCTQEERVGAKWVPWFLSWIIRSKQGRAMSQDRPLMTPGQIVKFLDRDHGNLIVVRYSKSPLKLKRVPYYRDLPTFLYSPSREHREAILRRFTRWICSFIWPGQSSSPPKIEEKELTEIEEKQSTGIEEQGKISYEVEHESE